MVHELRSQGLHFEIEKYLPMVYRGLKLDCRYRIDLIVEHQVVVELKAVEKLEPVHSAQLLTYLKLTGYRLGLLINFNVPVLKDGVRRLVYG
jgi:GxxExxY protein